MSRLLIACGLLVWIGATLVLSSSRRVARPSLVERLRPFSPGSAATTGGEVSIQSLGDVLGPLARDAGDRVAAVFGVRDRAEKRLERIHSPLTASAFRLRQMVWTGAALVGGAALATAASTPVALSMLLVAGSPLLAFLVLERGLARASERWQRTTEAELPIVSEQLAMLLNAGYSLGSALNRLARRGHGCVVTDLADVVNRVQQGLSEEEALREWAKRSGSPGVERLVGVLAVHSTAADIGRLISAEARSGRRDHHRRTIEVMERRGQQVWVPVTVATLLPGAILLSVPFLAALRLFANA